MNTHSNLKKNRQKILSIGFLIFVCAFIALLFVHFKFKPFQKEIVLPFVPFGADLGSTLVVGKEKCDAPLDLEDLQNSDKGLFQGAILTLNSGDYRTAYNQFSQIQSHNRNHPTLLYWLLKTASHLQLLPDHKLILDQISQKLIQNNPQNPYLMASAEWALKNKNYTLARDLLFKSIEQSPQCGESHLLKAQNDMGLGDRIAARKELQLAISLMAPKQLPALEVLAQYYQDGIRFDSLEILLDYAEKNQNIEKQSALLTYYQGLSSDYKLDTTNARRLYSTALSIALSDEQKNLILSAFSTIGQKKQPTQTAEEAIQNAPSAAEQQILDLLAKHPDDQGLLELLKKIRSEKAGNLSQNSSTPLPSNEDSLKRMVEEKKNKGIQSLKNNEQYGHYLVKWGTEPNVFISRYPQKIFKLISPGVYEENFYDNQFLHQYRAHFNQAGLYQVSSFITDTTKKSEDLYNQVLKTNQQYSGVGRTLEEIKCPGLPAFDGQAWDTPDQIEVLIGIESRPWQVRMVRVSKILMETPPKICDIAPLILEKARKNNELR